MVIEKLFIKIKANRKLTIVLPHGEMKFASSQVTEDGTFLYDLKEEVKGNVLDIIPLTDSTVPIFVDLTLERHGCNVRVVLDDYYIVDVNNTIVGVLIGHGIKNIGFGDNVKAIYTAKTRMDLIGLTYDANLVASIEKEERGE